MKKQLIYTHLNFPPRAKAVTDVLRAEKNVFFFFFVFLKCENAEEKLASGHDDTVQELASGNFDG